MNQQQTQTSNPGAVAQGAVVRDESLGDDGQVLPLWRYVLEGVNALGAQGLLERSDKARRILRDDGVTYTVYNQEQSALKDWDLDLIPYLIGSNEWAAIESGLLERAELFNLILKDLYGPMELIRGGVVPPEVIFEHGGFLRPCHGVSLIGEHQLILHAVDMVRAADGSVQVFADRAQSPSGAGYALENRTVMSRVLPSLFRDSQVHRLAHFFQRLRAKLNQLAPNVEEPRVVVLTPGALNETHFEHAYLANYLGYPLVQSGDLMVRNGFVWMKSLEGLARVDVILRRVDDWYCDPLELKSDSYLGVPGLLEVARLKRVAIANPLGSGVLENPALLKYLPQIGLRLLGREPRLSSVPTYWCGDADDCAYVLAHLDELLIKPIFRGGGGKSILPAKLSTQERVELAARIQMRPNQYVAQSHVLPSHVPTLVDGQLKPRPAVLRSFAVAGDASYTVMPGGLTRVGTSDDSPFITNQLGSANKDTWVIASEPERAIQTDAQREQVASAVIHTSLPSRVVENLFWFGRYAERAECCLRFLRTVFVLLNDADALTLECKTLLLKTVTKITASYPGFSQADEALIDNPEPELLAIVLDGNRAGSIKACLQAMLNCAEESKELLSSDTLRVINDVRDGIANLDAALQGGLTSAPEEALDPLVTTLMALSGLAQESMIRGVGWRFMEIGRRTERGLQTVTLVRELLAEPESLAEPAPVLQAMLLALEVLITYRRRYRGELSAVRGLELVLIDTSNPRSLLYQLEQLQDHVRALPDVGISSRELQPEERALLEAVSTLRLSHLVELANVSQDSGKRSLLDETMERMHSLLTTTSTAISDKYFDHRTSPQQLVRAVWEE